MRKIKPHGAVLAWYKAYSPSAFVIPSLVLFELTMGAGITRRQDISKATQLDTWIEAISSEAQILTLDAAAARKAASFMDRQSSDLIVDAMIAAIASVNGLTVATRNTKDFEQFGVRLVNPFLHR